MQLIREILTGCETRQLKARFYLSAGISTTYACAYDANSILYQTTHSTEPMLIYGV